MATDPPPRRRPTTTNPIPQVLWRLGRRRRCARGSAGSSSASARCSCSSATSACPARRSPAKQIPYLVSGGIGGMFLAVLGAYFLGTQELRKDSGRLDRLEQMVEELHQALLRRPDAPDLTALAPSTNGTERDARPGRSSPSTAATCSTAADCAMVERQGRRASSRRPPPASAACGRARSAAPAPAPLTAS